MRRLNSKDADFSDSLAKLLRRVEGEAIPVVESVSSIIAAVREQGDSALVRLTKQFDQLDLARTSIEISNVELEQAWQTISSKERAALEYAARRIGGFHERQRCKSWHYLDDEGHRLGQRVTPIQKVGLYVPGGRASYPSSVLMNAIPAKIAGVKEMAMVSPQPSGDFNPMVLAAAHLVGVDRIFRIGGAQAIGALAYGTQSVPKVDKIVGPGNAYVAEAKRQVFGQVGIDMIAGPSEVLVIADASCNPQWVTLDLFAQAEHDTQAQAILLTKDHTVADSVEACVNNMLPKQSRAEIIETSLLQHGAIIIANSDLEIVDIANQIAPEHLQLAVANSDTLADQVVHAGAVFIGPQSAEVFGDYCAGPNHVLPTSGSARLVRRWESTIFRNAAASFNYREMQWINLIDCASTLAQSESLTAHAESARSRKS